ncbi:MULTISPECIES: cytochrome c biogenesis CcdA family protein [Pseudothermotoga]|jgi:cytochrome c-type biogenesis protein|uniref:Cytochrome c biogenesis protein transmembrane region n=2 Tax=Pseudothermotoga TaxID=1643951 RepID=A8F3Y6_PSELT|nr:MULTISPECIES: cytochrome c biogenesis CcdA family protein [Pseudothermotoga]ABV32870.1 cytochrome c biogenesis protein transmembrane region [Pseudothermotoga lettingae TMO]KUK21834.1 MAG: Cytochrome c biogenesis protein transmembrane region [Pseudothermotoga lettingae]MDI3494067.1 cytochrome c-type biosis protein [Pseudothermotoga sp.]MDK2884917.1 cytochrome c-type biosis protein [Pseudothermotoga sp.]GLI48134.1 cytochrome C biogenesis protein CcdA [Pseudothermotoga lettingae TMO]
MGISVTQVDFITALTHGIISFFSPCVLPLIPAFIALILSEKGVKAFARIAGFLLGLSATFSLLGALSGLIGFLTNREITRYIAGSLIILMAIFFLMQIQLVKIKSFNFYRFKSGGFLSGIIIGIGIGLVWIPCASPVLASMLIIASAQGTMLKGSFLLFIYSLGISIPFLTIGSVISRVFSKISFSTPKWERFFRYLASAILVTIGLLIVTGKAFI